MPSAKAYETLPATAQGLREGVQAFREGVEERL